MIHGVSARARLIGGVLLGLVAPATLSCTNRDNRDTMTDAAREESPAGVTVITILENPANVYGKSVIVSGTVKDLRGPRAFTIGGEDWSSGKLLILAAEPLPTVKGRDGNTQLAAGDLVQVSGPVRRLVVADIEREIGFDLEPGLEKEFENKPVVVVKAKSVQVTPHRGLAAAPPSPRPDLNGDQGNVGLQVDSSAKDAGSTDAGHRDAGHRDAGHQDAGRDAGQRDSGARSSVGQRSKDQ